MAPDTEQLGEQALAKRLLSIKEVVTEYGVTTWYWRTLIWKGILPVINKNGKKQLIDRLDIEAFIRSSKS